MAKFVKLTSSGGKTVWVNPDNVKLVGEGPKSTRVWFEYDIHQQTSAFVDVQETPEAAAAALSD